jgi:7-alpha-hydroxysteroid dehydrogenase
MADRLQGKTVIVVGAGQTPGETIGNGRAMAVLFAREGAQVLCVDRVLERAEETAAMIAAEGGEASAFQADVTDAGQAAAIIETGKARLGRIDILVNNVGGSTYARFLDITDEDFRLTFDWCVTSAFIMSQLVAPHMIEAGHGNIVNISSGSARFGIRALTAYCVAKGGLEALTRAMAQELAPKIRVNAIALGSFATDGLQGSLDMMPGSQEKMQEATPLHRLGDVADLGRLCVYLSTRDCYATNAIFHVDGGIDSNNSPLPIPDY